MSTQGLQLPFGEPSNVPDIVIHGFTAEDVPIVGEPGKFRTMHRVEWSRKGQNGSQTGDKVERIRKTDPTLWAAMSRAYEYWLKGQEEPADGTPLSAWAGITKPMADRCRSFHIRTVEDVAVMTEEAMTAVGMGARDLKNRAVRYLDSRPQAALAEALETKDVQLAQQQQEIDELRATVERLAAAAGLTAGQKPPKPARAA